MAKAKAKRAKAAATVAETPIVNNRTNTWPHNPDLHCVVCLTPLPDFYAEFDGKAYCSANRTLRPCLWTVAGPGGPELWSEMPVVK